ncbi:hypothetical protein ACFWCM_12895 [Streptomyces albidoflavus]|jgi:hypothetical protein|uniref:hypothetical protein n=1 Tax=Streptomyces sp. W75 TaxID=1170711 RepID=UPI001868C44D|nr:hypothetical protein [Streptomyces sp. W75]
MTTINESNETAASQILPVHDGETPPEGQPCGMATPEDLEEANEQQEEESI